jgi:hypothetical protein
MRFAIKIICIFFATFASQVSAEKLKLCADGPFFDGASQIVRLDFARDCSIVIRRSGSMTWNGDTVQVNFNEDRFTVSSNLYGGWNADVYLSGMSNEDYIKAVNKKWVGMFLRDNLEALSKYRNQRAFRSMINFAENLKSLGDAAAATAFASNAEAEQERSQEQARLTAEAEVRRKSEEEAATSRRVADQRKQEAAVQANKQFRDSLSTMNAGQLFAKSDELSSQGDTTKAREVLRTLVGKFPNHPLAAPAAQQMASMNAASANSGGSASGTSSGAVSNVSVQAAGAGNCWDVLAKREKEYEAMNRRPVPAGSTPPLMRVMWMTADSMKIIDTYCAGDAKAAKYRGELQTAYNQSKTACEQMTAGGQCSANPY